MARRMKVRHRSLLSSICVWAVLIAPLASGTAAEGVATAGQERTGDQTKQPPITPQQIQQLIDATSTKVAVDVGDRAAIPLGLAAPGGHYLCRQIGFPTATEGHDRLHRFCAPVDGSDKLLVFYAEDNRYLNLWAFDRNGNLLSAGLVRERKLSLLPVEQALASFEAEMKLWALEAGRRAKGQAAAASDASVSAAEEAEEQYKEGQQERLKELCSNGWASEKECKEAGVSN